MKVRGSLILILTLAAACSRHSADERVTRHAAARLAVDAASLRVSAQTDLEGARHRFYLVSQAGRPVLIVVEPRDGELFDDRTPDAFERVARAEGAATNVSQLGAEKVALWYGALGGDTCPPPASSEAHFAQVEHDADGPTIRYPAGGSPAKVCVVSLAVDSSIRRARLADAPEARAAARVWKTDVN